MGLKSYTLRLDEGEYEKLRSFLDTYGDPDLNMSFILRRYIRDLNVALPNLKKNTFGLLNMLTFYGTALKQLLRTGQIENLMKGQNPFGDTATLDQAQLEIDDRKELEMLRRAQKDVRRSHK